ncbi:MAG: hypothetical protein ABT04_03485 [Granulicella sp. SCN 62-9]|nr:MAG: hypothetical protein ABT04_03485 [Granulicella sp. SCN 62-9]
MQQIARGQPARGHGDCQATYQHDTDDDADARAHGGIHPGLRLPLLVERQRNQRAAHRPQPAQRGDRLESRRNQAQHRGDNRYQKGAADRRLPLDRTG